MRPIHWLLVAACFGLACGHDRDGDAGAIDGAIDPGADGGTIDAALVADAGPRLGTHEVLFVGNSYVYVNDVSGHYHTLAASRFATVRVEEVTTGGYTLAQHSMDARTDGTPLARFLRTGTADETDFDFVILQEQSQIGGFPEGDTARIESVAAASELATLATARGAGVVLYLTWGRERGDELNPELFPTFEVMQDRLDAGYIALAERLSGEGAAVRVAPVGGGFRLVFEDVLAAGLDPLAEGSEFDALFEPDGSHPSLDGAYLAACILAGTTTGAEVASFPDEETLGVAGSAHLRDVCGRALIDPRWRYTAPTRAEETLASSTPAMAGHLGGAVALDGDGVRALIGVPGEQRAAVLLRGPLGWSEEATLAGPEVGFGLVVALSGDGTRAVVAAPHAEVDAMPDAGLVRVFVRSGSTWTEEATLDPSGPPAMWPQLGTAIAMDHAGSRVFVGAPGDVGVAEATGSLRVFSRTGSVWSQEALFTAGDGAPGDRLGASVACGSDGTRVIVGASRDSAGVGRALVLVRAGSTWTLEATLTRGGSDTDDFGAAVAMASDGSVALVGAPYVGEVLPFTRSGTAWSRGAPLVLPGSELGDEAGAAIAISGDGRRALVGASRAATAVGPAAGRAWRFALGESTAMDTGPLAPRIPAAGARFGASLALDADGTSGIVGAWGASPGAVFQAGEVHVFGWP